MHTLAEGMAASGSEAFAGEVTAEGIPVIDLSLELGRVASAEADAAAHAECVRCAEAFHRFGVIAVRDPRVSMEDNDRYVCLWYGLCKVWRRRAVLRFP